MQGADRVLFEHFVGRGLLGDNLAADLVQQHAPLLLGFAKRSRARGGRDRLGSGAAAAEQHQLVLKTLHGARIELVAQLPGLLEEAVSAFAVTPAQDGQSLSEQLVGATIEVGCTRHIDGCGLLA